MLYLVATPIGNLDDISLRALATLKRCDYILAEDTRHSAKLLSHFEIQKPLISFHQHNERERQERCLQDIKEGKEVALISDAGTPLISDPGFLLVKACISAKLPITALPGPASCIVALTLSGLEPTPFQFVGFLPRKTSELADRLEELLEYPGTSICYETAQRLEETLQALCGIDPNCTISVARELTKHYESVVTDTCQQILSMQKTTPFLGEIVLLIAGHKVPPAALFSKEFLQAAVADVAKSTSTKEAIALVARQLKLPKRVVYSAIHIH